MAHRQGNSVASEARGARFPLTNRKRIMRLLETFDAYNRRIIVDFSLNADTTVARMSSKHKRFLGKGGVASPMSAERTGSGPSYSEVQEFRETDKAAFTWVGTPPVLKGRDR